MRAKKRTRGGSMRGSPRSLPMRGSLDELMSAIGEVVPDRFRG
jgi:hypothetical protein